MSTSNLWCRAVRAVRPAALVDVAGPARAARGAGTLARLAVTRERRRHQGGHQEGQQGGQQRGNAGGRDAGGTSAAGGAGRSLVAGLAVATLSTKALHQLDQDAVIAEPRDDVLRDVDRLMDWARADEASKTLNQYGGSRHPEVLWRRGRILYLLAEEAKNSPGGRARRGPLVREGYAAVQAALDLDPDCGRAHQWMSVLRYSLAELDGTLARLRSVDNIRKDMERAIQLLPGEDVPCTMLGMWFFEMSQLTWLERQVVQAAGQTVPCPDYALRQALHWFREAERLQQSCLNLLMLGKALLAGGEPDRARPYVERAATIPATTSSNAKAQLDARQLLECWKQQ